ncbi:FAD-dependent oxidoreductase [Salibacterium aidingense]|uniref:FAD-dependent oxidoreductase n=1 Tax=Salibacterium aidingense TaxID=384933 RepID=UPI0003F6FC4C|nr:FAD-dependent monooxygenase [Salibacterium aidingense]
MRPRILFVGAGPTGLVLALCLAQYNIPFRIIDKESGPGSSSRAIAVQARSLEYCRQLGIAEDVIKNGMKVNTGHIRQHNRRNAVFPLGDLGEGIGTLLRKTVPSVLPLFLQQHGRRQTIFNTISQVKVSYESSRMSEGKAGKVRSGQRLPWVAGETEDNHAPLASMDWQVHVYGKAAPAVIKFLPFPVHEFTWSRAAYKKGLKENVLYLIRPDGHIACTAKAEHPEILTNYIEKWKLQLIQGEQ